MYEVQSDSTQLSVAKEHFVFTSFVVSLFEFQ